MNLPMALPVRFTDMHVASCVGDSAYGRVFERVAYLAVAGTPLPTRERR